MRITDFNCQIRVRRRAVTLVEALVAAVLLGVGVAGLLSAGTLGLRNQNRSEDRAGATELAQELLARVDAAGAHAWLLGQPMRGQEDRGDVVYDWRLKIEQQALGELFLVSAQVDWARSGSGGTVTLATMMNDYASATAQAMPQERQR